MNLVIWIQFHFLLFSPAFPICSYHLCNEDLWSFLKFNQRHTNKAYNRFLWAALIQYTSLSEYLFHCWSFGITFSKNQQERFNFRSICTETHFLKFMNYLCFLYLMCMKLLVFKNFVDHKFTCEFTYSLRRIRFMQLK